MSSLRVHALRTFTWLQRIRRDNKNFTASFKIESPTEAKDPITQGWIAQRPPENIFSNPKPTVCWNFLRQKCKFDSSTLMLLRLNRRWVCIRRKFVRRVIILLCRKQTKLIDNSPLSWKGALTWKLFDQFGFKFSSFRAILWKGSLGNAFSGEIDSDPGWIQISISLSLRQPHAISPKPNLNVL